MFRIKYPYQNDEILNLDWILSKVKELDNKVNTIVEKRLNEAIDEYFNSFMVNAIYHEDAREIELKKEITVADGVHTYNAGDDSMSIGG